MNLRLLLALLLIALPAHAGVEQLSETEFQKLSEDLAPKVNLFHDAWEKDPTAEFYGGTTRDYLYWVKGQFRNAHTPEAAKKVADELRALPVIDVRSFIIGESDVDVFTKQAYSLRPEAYGVRKIDLQSPEMLDPATELGKNERHQGFIPAEKIRLGKEGFAKPAELGDGLGEIYRGQLTVHFANAKEFATTKYAKEGLNHPVLLALRYLRLQAIDFYQTHGAGLPDRKALLARMDPDSAKAVRKVIDGALGGEQLKPYLAREKFKSWINGAIQKAFRSYTNPTAARELMHEFRVDELPTLYPEIETTNQYVFQKYRDEKAIASNLKKYGVDRNAFFRPVSEEFPDGRLYHGTRTEPVFRTILMQGVLNSEGGTAGKGLYGVRESSRAFAENWGGDKKRLLAFPVKPEAKVVDIREGEGARVLAEFLKKNPARDVEDFAEAFGADIIRYPYAGTDAYVVKNSAALGKAEGFYRQLLPLQELLKRASTISDLKTLFELADVNSLSEKETTRLLEASAFKVADAARALRDGPGREAIIQYYLPRPDFPNRDAIVAGILEKGTSTEQSALLRYVFANPLVPLEEATWKSLGRQESLAKEIVETLLERYARKNSDVPSLRSEHRLLLREMLDHGLLDHEQSRVLAFPGIKQDESIVRSSRPLLPAFVERQLTFGMEADPFVLPNIIAALDPHQHALDQDLLRKVASLPGAKLVMASALLPDARWRTTALVDLLAEEPGTHGEIATEALRQRHERQQHQAAFRKILAEGHADAELAHLSLRLEREGEPIGREELARTLLSRKPPRTEVVYPLYYQSLNPPELRALWEQARDRALAEITRTQDFEDFMLNEAHYSGSQIPHALVDRKAAELLAADDTKDWHHLDQTIFHPLAERWATEATPGSDAGRALRAFLHHPATKPETRTHFDLRLLTAGSNADEALKRMAREDIRVQLKHLADERPNRLPSAKRLTDILNAVKGDAELRADQSLSQAIAGAVADLEENTPQGLHEDTLTNLRLTLELMGPNACPSAFSNLAGSATR